MRIAVGIVALVVLAILVVSAAAIAVAILIESNDSMCRSGSMTIE